MEEIRPFLKWAGGKTQLLNLIGERFPAQYKNYIEPFVGGGAVFFALSPESAIISDSNPELINLYIQLRDNVDSVIKELYGFENSKDEYYRIRALQWDELPNHFAAARMIYLNKTCFNGLYRVNKSGLFNVPYSYNYNMAGLSQVRFVLCPAHSHTHNNASKPSGSEALLFSFSIVVAISGRSGGPRSSRNHKLRQD